MVDGGAHGALGSSADRADHIADDRTLTVWYDFN